MTGEIQLIAGSSYPSLAQRIGRRLKIKVTPTEIKRFADGEIYVRIKKKVRGNDVFVIQSLYPPANEHLMELLIIIDALKRASARRINIICPYLCYSRQDRKVASREPITAKLVANLITRAGADRLVTIDLHADQIQGYYDIPVDHFFGYSQFGEFLKKHFSLRSMVVVSPDIGGVKRAHKLADFLNVPLAVIDKVRKKHNHAQVEHIVGEVKGKRVVIIDDIIDTGGSIAAAARALKKVGAAKVVVCASHAIFSEGASEKLRRAPLDKILLLDTIPLPAEKKTPQMKILPLSPLWAKIIRRIHIEHSLGTLFV